MTDILGITATRRPGFVKPCIRCIVNCVLILFSCCIHMILKYGCYMGCDMTNMAVAIIFTHGTLPL